jgi:hypothetical protein
VNDQDAGDVQYGYGASPDSEVLPVRCGWAATNTPGDARGALFRDHGTGVSPDPEAGADRGEFSGGDSVLAKASVLNR